MVDILKAFFEKYMISQNESNGVILLYEIEDGGKYIKRFRCDSPKNKYMDVPDLIRVGKCVVRNMLKIGKMITLYSKGNEGDTL